MALVIAYLSLASIHECTNFSSNSSTRRSRFPVPLPQLLDVLPLFLFQGAWMQVCSTVGERCARCVNVCPLDKAGRESTHLPLTSRCVIEHSCFETFVSL